MMFICSPEGHIVCKNSSEFLAEQASEIKRGDATTLLMVKVLQDHASLNHALRVVPLKCAG
jgi:hypothetical protein